MATIGTYCFDGINFSQATSLYTDSTLTVLAPDGYYAQGQIARHQLNGILLNIVSCSSCLAPCGTGVAQSVNDNGIFKADLDLGDSIGAVVMYFYMGDSIPDGVLCTYDTVTYNRLTCQDNNGSLIEDNTLTSVVYAGINNQGTGLPTYVGRSNSSLISESPYNTTPTGACVQGDQPQDWTLVSNAYVQENTGQDVTVVNNQIGTVSASSPVFTMVVPKRYITPTPITLDIYAPLCGTVFEWELACPVSLPSFTASAAQDAAFVPAPTKCSAAIATYYFVRNATRVSGVPFTVDVNTLPEVGNFVFTDSSGVNYLNDTAVEQWYIIGNSTYIKVKNGVVIETGACT